jgi:selenocysteine lyase/cysteine desulfurase
MNWHELRTQFPVTQHWAFLDHAAVAPLPSGAVAALHEYAADLASHGIAAYARWANRITQVRAWAGQLLNTAPTNIAFTKNTTEGIGWVAEGVPWQPGDNVVLAAEEYPSNQYPWLNLHARGVSVRAVPSRGNTVAIDDVFAACDARTRLVSLSFVEFASGYRNDLDAIGQFCRERGLYFFVDAIQGLGVIPLDVQQTPIDFLSADGHKWLLGPEGAGLFYIRPELVEVLHPVGVGWNSVVDCYNFGTINFTLKPHAGRWEGGAYNVPGITAFGASLEWLLSLGIAKVRDRIAHLTDHLCMTAERAGLTVFSQRSPAAQSGIVALEVPGADPHALQKRCRQAGIIVNVRNGRIRLSPHVYNTTEELDRAIACLAGK